MKNQSIEQWTEERLAKLKVIECSIYIALPTFFVIVFAILNQI